MSRYENLGTWGKRMLELREKELGRWLRQPEVFVPLLEDVELGLGRGDGLRAVWEALQQGHGLSLSFEVFALQCEAIGVVATTTDQVVDHDRAEEAGLTFSAVSQRQIRQRWLLAGNVGEPPRKRLRLPHQIDRKELYGDDA